MDYVISIDLDGSSGKEKASREKSEIISSKYEGRTYSVSYTKTNSYIYRIWLFFYLELKYLLLSFTNIKKPDIIISRSVFCFGVYLVGKIYAIPVVREVHGVIEDEAGQIFKSRLLIVIVKIYSYYLNFFIRNSDGIIFNHPTLMDYYIKKLKINIEKTPCIYQYNGCNTVDFYHQDRDFAIRELGLDHSKKYLIFLGSVSKWHGVELLLEVFKKINTFNDEFILLIVGSANVRYLETLIEDCQGIKNIVFIGSVDIKTAKTYLNASSISMIPVADNRISPGSPLKLFDSIACGIPVVVQKDTLGYSDIVEDYGIGISCDFHNTNKAANTILKFMETNREKFRIHNIEISKRELSWDRAIDNWMRFCKKEVLVKNNTIKIV